MKQLTITIIFFCFLFPAFGQNNIVKTAGVSYTAGAPTFSPGRTGSQVAIDTATGLWYEYNGASWSASGYRIQTISGCSAPAYTPAKYQSRLVVNACTVMQGGPELYYWTGSAWVQLNAGGTLDGEVVGPIDQTVLDTVQRVMFDQTPSLSGGIGTLNWNDTDGTLDLGLKGGTVSLQVGQESVIRVVNKSGVTLNDGNVVYISGAQGNRIAVKLATATNDTMAATVLGVVTETILNNQEGFITTEGLVRGLNTSSFPEGTLLYLSNTPGALTATEPTAPSHAVIVAYCVRQHATVGSVFVKVDNSKGLTDLHDVLLDAPANGQVLKYISGLWTNADDEGTVYTAGTGIDITGTVISNTAPNQTVSISEGAGIDVTGTYPNFTVAIPAGGVTPTEIQSTAVTPGSYTYMSGTVDADGRLTAAGSGTAPVTGTGTTNYVPKWASSSALGNSIISENGTVLVGLLGADHVEIIPGASEISFFDVGYIDARIKANVNVLETNVGMNIAGNTGVTGNLSVSGTISTSSVFKAPGITSSSIFAPDPPAAGSFSAWATSGSASYISFTESGTGNQAAFGRLPSSGDLVWSVGALALTSGTERMRMTNSGNLGIGTTPSSKLDVTSSNGYSQLRLRTTYTPTGTGDGLGATGDTAWDSNYFYIKTAAGWKRAALSTF